MMLLTAQFFCCVLVEEGIISTSLCIKRIMFMKGSSFKISSVGIKVGACYYTFCFMLSSLMKRKTRNCWLVTFCPTPNQSKVLEHYRSSST